ncbi:MAG: caspase family protein [Hylemonella sp.]|nr:caspase family protein [Hylemonella sp.]
MHLSAQERNLSVTASPANAKSGRVALVIGNASYADSPLKNPVNDARAMAKSLREMGFEVITRENANLQQMDNAVREFGRRLEQAHVGLFYFAGHGIQIKGRNFLIPVGADFQHEDEVPYRSMDAGQVLDKMDSAKTRVNLVILDACRNNPFHRNFRARRQGLAEMEAPAGTLIGFATAPGAVALDGEGSHGVYTQHLLKQMSERGLPVEQVFKRVRVGVSAETGERQIPWESSSLREEFQFRQEAVMTARPPVPVNEVALELAFWDAIKSSKRADDYAAYLEQFPKGRFVALARNRMRDFQPVADVRPLPATQQVAAVPAPAAVAPQQAAAGAQAAFLVAGTDHTALAFSGNDQWLAIVRRDGWLLLREVASGKPTADYKLEGTLSSVRFAPDSATIAVGTETGEMRLIDRVSGRELWRRLPHSGKVLSLVFSPDGRYLLSAAANGEVELTSVANGKSVQSLRNDGMPLADAQYSPDGRYVAVVLGEGRSHVVKVVEVGSGREMLTVAAAAASFSVNGRHLLVAAGGHTPTLFDVASGREMQRFTRYPLQIVAGAYAESGDYVATVDAEGHGLRLDTRSGQPVAAVRGAPVRPRAAAFSTDVSRYALIDEQGRVAVYRFQE